MASKGPQRKLLSGSENCNPNVIHGSCKRKINNCPKSSAAEQILESNNTPKQLTGQACAEFNLISPPRKHVCSSRRCASKNPDYAVPATVNPKKFLASKRHALLPKGSTMCKCCLRTRKGEDSAADDQFGSIEVCNRCSHESQKRRWSSDDSASRHLTENGEPMTFSLTSPERRGLHYPDSEQVEKASMNEAVRLAASETAHQERSIDTPKSWNCWNHSPILLTNHVDTQDHPLKTVTDVNQSEDSTPPGTLASFSGSESKHRAAYSNKRELQASPLPAGEGLCRSAGEGLYRFGTSCLNSTPEQSSSAAAHDGNPSQLMPENEEGAISPSPEKSGNWRLNAVLESFGNLSPTREGRVKTLVRAFESLLSVTERKVEQQARKPGGCLKFSYLSSNTNLDGEENSPREEDLSTYGGEGESEKEGATDDEEERVGQWQPSLSMGDAKDDEVDDRWQRPHTEPVYFQSIVESEQWLQKQDVEQECAESREEIVSDEERDGLEKLLQNQEEAQEVHAQSVVSDEGKGGMVLQEGGVNYEDAQEVNDQSVVEDADKGGMGKRWQEHEAEREYAQSLQEGVNDEEVGKMEKLSQKQQQDDEGKQPDEQQGAGVFAQTPEKRYETDKGEQQPRDMVSTQKLLFEGEAKKDRASQELEVRDVPDFSVNPMEASFVRKFPHQIIRTNIQRRSSQTSVDGHFASTAARKKQRSRIRESRRGSNCSISSTRPPLLQKSQTQYAQDKPRFSKPQPFKLLTEARGHMKEQEFMSRLRKLLEEEEKLRVPLAQGLPWTTDEPEIPLKPPVKENTKPLDIHLNTDLRAMERADFDRFIAEKLLYIEERRLEEESRRRAAEEEEIKKMRQDMVPKAQLMPYFDRPFRPRRSSKRPTIPKEPQFQLNKQQPKRQKCVGNST